MVDQQQPGLEESLGDLVQGLSSICCAHYHDSLACYNVSLQYFCRLVDFHISVVKGDCLNSLKLKNDYSNDVVGDHHL